MTVSSDSSYAEILKQLEKRLVESGWEAEIVHEWVFHIRDVMGDWNRQFKELAEIANTPDVNEIPRQLESFQESILYGVVPHTEYHMNELEKLLEKVFPPEKDLSYGIDVVIDGVNDFEKRLVASGYNPEAAHQLVSKMESLLFDWRGIQLDLVNALSEQDDEKALKQFDALGARLPNGIKDEIGQHITDLLETTGKDLPPDENEDSDETEK